jgi:hypothetical protein
VRRPAVLRVGPAVLLAVAVVPAGPAVVVLRQRLTQPSSSSWLSPLS